MINLLEDYIATSLPEGEDFSTNPNLRKKVAEDGRFLPFFGNTAVFLLNEETKAALKTLQEELYKAAGWVLSQKLEPETFHMTLHDLVNAPEMSDDLRNRMQDAEENARKIIEQWSTRKPLRMKTTWLFNMVSTSIVLGLAPADEESWRLLDEMYTALETVIPLGYGLTPHITMAYYRPGTYFQWELSGLKNALRPVELEITLDMKDLVLQNFTDMNHYETIAP